MSHVVSERVRGILLLRQLLYSGAWCVFVIVTKGLGGTLMGPILMR